MRSAKRKTIRAQARLAGALALALVGLIAPERGFAQAGQAEFERGMSALNAGRYELAVEAFNNAYRREPSAIALYQLGLAYNGIAQPAKALESFESFVTYADPVKEAAQLNAAKSEIARIKSSIGRFALKISPPRAAIKIDGHGAALKNNEIWMLPGRHTIDINAAGFESYSQALEVQSGRYSLEINLRALVGTPAEVATRLVDAGMALKVQGDLQAASAKFQEAEHVFSTPRGLAQLGLVEEALADQASAEDHITAALAARKDPWIRKNKSQLRQALNRIMRVTKNYAKLDITGANAGAQILINARLAGTLPLGRTLRVPAGHVVVLARLEGFQDYVFEADLPRRSLKPVIVTMDPLPAPPIPPPPPKPVAAPPPPPPPPPPLPVVEPEPEPVAQADMDAVLAQGQEPQGEGPTATGFELGFNLGYQLWLDQGPFRSSGGPSMQLSVGARPLWPFSFGVELLGLTGDFSGSGQTDFIVTGHPAFYLRGHIQKTRRPFTFDVWGGAAIAPFAMGAAAFESGSTEIERVAQSGTSAAQRRAIMQRLGVGDLATFQTINVPLQLGTTFFITRGIGVDLSMALTLWFPRQLCYHDGSESYCVESGLESYRSFFIGAGLSVLP